VRVSTTDQNVARQDQANREAAEQAGWHITEYDDPGLSASRFATRDRPGWSRLRADLAAGRIDVIVLWEPSRGDRQLAGWADLLDACRKTGTLVHITSHRRTYNPADARDWRSLAEDGIDSAYESEKLSTRIRDGKQYWAGKRGQDVTGRARYGVHRVNADRARNRWEADAPHPEQARIVARIVSEVAAGVPLVHIARALTADGVPTPRGAAEWSGWAVARIAAWPGYVNLGIVTEADSLAARDRLARSKRTGERPAAAVFRYSGCLACAVCGKPVRGLTRDGAGRYICPAVHVSIPAAGVDAWVDANAIDALSRPDYYLPLFADIDSADAEEARTEAARLQAELDEWVTTPGISPRAYALKEAELAPRIKAAERRALQASAPGVLAGLPDEDRTVVAERWAALTTSARKAAIRALAPRAELRRGRRGPVRSPVAERVILWPEQQS
jgi:DNA invertase Pin-like site-specific DNA recombinase